MDRRLNVVVDPASCVGNQMCVQLAPGVFELDEGGQSRVIDVAGGSVEDIIEAGLNCPVSAISVTDADTGEDLLA